MRPAVRRSPNKLEGYVKIRGCKGGGMARAGANYPQKSGSARSLLVFVTAPDAFARRPANPRFGSDDRLKRASAAPPAAALRVRERTRTEVIAHRYGRYRRDGSIHPETSTRGRNSRHAVCEAERALRACSSVMATAAAKTKRLRGLSGGWAEQRWHRRRGSRRAAVAAA